LSLGIAINNPKGREYTDRAWLFLLLLNLGTPSMVPWTECVDSHFFKSKFVESSLPLSNLVEFPLLHHAEGLGCHAGSTLKGSPEAGLLRVADLEGDLIE